MVRLMHKKHIGSNFDEFLEEKGLLAEAETVAVKRVKQDWTTNEKRLPAKKTGRKQQARA